MKNKKTYTNDLDYVLRKTILEDPCIRCKKKYACNARRRGRCEKLKRYLLS